MANSVLDCVINPFVIGLVVAVVLFVGAAVIEAGR